MSTHDKTKDNIWYVLTGHERQDTKIHDTTRQENQSNTLTDRDRYTNRDADRQRSIESEKQDR